MGFCVFMPQLYFSREDIKIRIEEIRRQKDRMDTEEFDLVCQFKSLEDKDDCVVDLRGRVLGVKDKKPKTTYAIMKATGEDRMRVRKRLLKAHGVEMKV